LTYIGRSEIVSPQGEILGRMGDTDVGILCSDVDLAVAKDKHLNTLNDLFAGRRPDQYRIE
jgi:predicted amidohydrolase